MTVGQRNLIIRFLIEKKNGIDIKIIRTRLLYTTPPSCLFLHHHHHGDLLLLLYWGEIRLPSLKNFPRMFSLVT